MLTKKHAEKTKFPIMIEDLSWHPQTSIKRFIIIQKPADLPQGVKFIIIATSIKPGEMLPIYIKEEKK